MDHHELILQDDDDDYGPGQMDIDNMLNDDDQFEPHNIPLDYESTEFIDDDNYASNDKQNNQDVFETCIKKNSKINFNRYQHDDEFDDETEVV